MELLLDRRKFLKDAGALTVSAAVMGASAPAMASAVVADNARIRAVLFDSRYASCREFAAALAREGALALDLQPDPAAVWLGPLREHLAQQGGGVAGLAANSDFVLAVAFSRNLGLSRRYEGSHDARGSHLLTHRLRGANAGEIASTLGREDSSWPRDLAQALARLASADPTQRRETSIAHTSGAEDHPGFLQSWLLTPTLPGLTAPPRQQRLARR